MQTHYLKYYLFIMLCYGSSLSSCQSKKSLTEKSTSSVARDYIVTGNYKFLATDKLDFVYLVSEDNEILQLKDNKILFRYSNRRLGDITKIDVSNPQKLLVYYGDYYQLVFLDNTLSAIKQLDLEGLGYWDISGVAMSRDNQIWIYDPVNVRLLKINEGGTIQLSSNELYNYGIPADSNLDLLVSEEYIYLYDNEVLNVFDEFGLWQKKIVLDNDRLQAKNGYLVYKDDNKLNSYSIKVEFKDPSEAICPIDSSVRDFYLTNEKVYCIDERGLFMIRY